MITLTAVINSFIVVGCIAFLGWRGYERGFFPTVQRFLSALAGYLACYFLVGYFSTFLASTFVWPLLRCYLIAAILLIVVVAAVVNFLFSNLLTYLENQEQEPAHIAGLLSGILLGCFLGVVTVWLGGIAMDAIQLNQNGISSLEARPTDPIRKLAGNMVGSMVGAVVENKVGNQNLVSDVTAQLIGDPVTTSQQLVQISKSEEIKNFFSDPSAQQLMLNNQVGDLQNNASFQTWVKTPQASQFLSLLDSSVKPNAKPEASTKEEKAANLLTMLYQKGTRLNNDPRYIELSHTPEFQRLLQNPTPVEMATNPVLKELAEIVFSEQTSKDYVVAPVALESLGKQSGSSSAKLNWQPVKPSEQDSTDVSSTQESAGTTQTIYRWTDENGKIHFSQTKPDGNYALEVIKTQ